MLALAPVVIGACSLTSKENDFLSISRQKKSKPSWRVARRPTMNPRIKDRLIKAAIDNPGVRGKFKMAACVLNPKGYVVGSGVNSYKTHPIMANGFYKEEQIYLHAEAAAIVDAMRTVRMDPLLLYGHTLYVARVKKGENMEWTEALAKPCKGCMGLIQSVNIDTVEWTEDA